MNMQSVMTNSHYAALLILVTKIIKQIRLSLIWPNRKIMAFYKYPIYFLYSSFITKDLKQNKELFSIIKSPCGEKINLVRMNTFLELLLLLLYFLPKAFLKYMQIFAANNLCHILPTWRNAFKYKSIIVIVWFFFPFYNILNYVKISFGQSCISNLIFALYIT